MLPDRPLTLISHPLCPYVQRAAIALTEKRLAFERIDIDLTAKPDWFLAISPLGKTPVLRVASTSIFESAVILEYLEESYPHDLHPAAPLQRAEHRGWIEFSSTILNDIAALYNAPDPDSFTARSGTLHQRFARVERRLGDGPFFDGDRFSLVDTAFAPVFRYFDIFDRIGDFGILKDLPRIERWRSILASRPSVQDAVAPDYPQRLRMFLIKRHSYLSSLIAGPTSHQASPLPAVSSEGAYRS